MLILAEEAKHDPLEAFIWMQSINNSFCFSSAETHMFGMQRFWETHFMLIVYLIRNFNCSVRLINLWESNRSIVYPHVMLFVYVYEIFISWQGSLATAISLWYDVVWSQVSWHCHHQLPWQETRNNVKGTRRQLQNNTESSFNKRETDRTSWSGVTLCQVAKNVELYSKWGFELLINTFSAERINILKDKTGIIQYFPRSTNSMKRVKPTMC